MQGCRFSRDRYDFLVVGAGIVGLATAVHLAEECRGCSIAVIEKHPGPGHGDSGRSAAAFRAVFSSRLNAVLALSSIRYYLGLQENGIDLGMRLLGYLFVLPGDRVSVFEEAARALQGLGVEHRWYDASELEELLGVRRTPVGDAEVMGLPPVEAGILFQPAGIMRPERLVEYYASRAAGLGIEAVYGCRVDRLLVEAEPPLGVRGEPLPWQRGRVAGVEAGGREVRASTVVVAAGAEAYRILEPIGVDPHFRPRKQRVYVVRASTEGLKRLLHSEGFNEDGVAPFILLPRGIYIRPVPEEESFWTGGSTRLGHPIQWEPEPQPEPWVYEYGVAPVLRSYIPAFEDAPGYDAAWAGFYDTSIDARPVVHSPAEGLVVAGGTSGSGIMKADAVGRAAAALALGREEARLHGGFRVELRELGLWERRLEQEQLVI